MQGRDPIMAILGMTKVKVRSTIERILRDQVIPRGERNAHPITATAVVHFPRPKMILVNM